MRNIGDSSSAINSHLSSFFFQISISLGALLGLAAYNLGWEVHGPVLHRVIGRGELLQCFIFFEITRTSSFQVYGEAVPSIAAAKASTYLYALWEVELMGYDLIDLHHAEYVARIMTLSCSYDIIRTVTCNLCF